MTLRDFIKTMDLSDYSNTNKTKGNIFINFNNTNDCCINFIGNPKNRSEDFNANQIKKIIDTKIGDYVITNWKMDIEKNGDTSFYFTFLK